jgi:hypothetical protein
MNEISGGHLSEIPEPHVRMFPGENKRRVSVSIAVYDIVGGRHYRVSLYEDDNPIWDCRTRKQEAPGIYERVVRQCMEKDTKADEEYWAQACGWRLAWDDDNGRGREFHSGALDFLYQVEDFITETWEENFSDKTHYLSNLYCGDEVTIASLVAHWREVYQDVENYHRDYVYPRDGD